MLRFQSPNIVDISPMKIKHWDNSVLLVRSGYPVAVKCPSNNTLEWLTTEKEDDKFILQDAKSEEAMTECGTVMVPNLSQFINIGLYFSGHLDNDIILQNQPDFAVLL